MQIGLFEKSEIIRKTDWSWADIERKYGHKVFPKPSPFDDLLYLCQLVCNTGQVSKRQQRLLWYFDKARDMKRKTRALQVFLRDFALKTKMDFGDLGKVNPKSREVFRKAYFKRKGWTYKPATLVMLTTVL